MLEEAKLLIKSSTGYVVPDDDADILQYLWKMTEEEIKNLTHQEVLPDALDGLHTRWTVGRYLSMRLETIVGSDNLQTVSQITEGKVSVQIRGTTKAERVNALASAFLLDEGNEIACLRKLKW